MIRRMPGGALFWAKLDFRASPRPLGSASLPVLGLEHALDGRPRAGWIPTPGRTGEQRVLPLAAGGTLHAARGGKLAGQAPRFPPPFHWRASTRFGEPLLGGWRFGGDTCRKSTHTFWRLHWLRIQQQKIDGNVTSPWIWLPCPPPPLATHVAPLVWSQSQRGSRRSIPGGEGRQSRRGP